MPLFEYMCRQCGRRFSVLVGMTASPDADVCPRCGSAETERRVSRFAHPRGASVDGDPAADASPAAMRAWAKELGEEAGEDLGDDFDEYLDAAEDDA